MDATARRSDDRQGRHVPAQEVLGVIQAADLAAKGSESAELIGGTGTYLSRCVCWDRLRHCQAASKLIRWLPSRSEAVTAGYRLTEGKDAVRGDRVCHLGGPDVDGVPPSTAGRRARLVVVRCDAWLGRGTCGDPAAAGPGEYVGRTSKVVPERSNQDDVTAGPQRSARNSRLRRRRMR